ncbi:hypothetical protein CROQUDRAFT_92895 [Cronartium quercuum f. sp. fusiforme G11]|uniref:Uncharacterized protein n=1 Tax=Cronartium quercuum f. sp. fusiforme G11 TaxID=708437 RepID=A0A9P6NG47_9BASI|nr:hypothetical protein CROQUDRAFT_92895 [Cronartium quercuum f. sp. fusiforme G11]
MDRDHSISQPSSPTTPSSPLENPTTSSPTISVHSDTSDNSSNTINHTIRERSEAPPTFDYIHLDEINQMADMTTNTSTTQVSLSQSNYSSIPTLSTGNFHAWRMRLVTFLGALNLQDYILKDIEVPTDPVLLNVHMV